MPQLHWQYSYDWHCLMINQRSASSRRAANGWHVEAGLPVAWHVDF
jgi:hypothetical protein